MAGPFASLRSMLTLIFNGQSALRLCEEPLRFIPFTSVQVILVFGSELGQKFFDGGGWQDVGSLCGVEVIRAGNVENITRIAVELLEPGGEVVDRVGRSSRGCQKAR